MDAVDDALPVADVPQLIGRHELQLITRIVTQFRLGPRVSVICIGILAQIPHRLCPFSVDFYFIKYQGGVHIPDAEVLCPEIRTWILQGEEQVLQHLHDPAVRVGQAR